MRRGAAAALLLTAGLVSVACKKPSSQVARSLDGSQASDSRMPEASAPEVRPSQGREPTMEEQQESFCQRHTPLSGETIPLPELDSSSFFPFGEDLVFRDGDRVLRRSGADGSSQVLLEQPGLVSIDRQGDQLLLFVRRKGRASIERRPLDRPATVSAHRDVVTKLAGDVFMGEGWFRVDDIHLISPDVTPSGMWGESHEVGHLDGKNWEFDLPDPRLGGSFVGFSVNAKHLFWWVRDVRPEDAVAGKYSDFKVRSLEPDGRTNVLRTIEGFVTALVVNEERADEPKIVWMDTSEGPCDSDVRPYRGVVWLAPLAGGAPRRILGGQVCARAMVFKGDDIFWATETRALWWASATTGQHMLVGGACDRAWVWPTNRWVYIRRERQGADAGTRELVRIPWWR
jgi:hypothetical protein